MVPYKRATGIPSFSNLTADSRRLIKLRENPSVVSKAKETNKYDF